MAAEGCFNGIIAIATTTITNNNCRRVRGREKRGKKGKWGGFPLFLQIYNPPTFSVAIK